MKIYIVGIVGTGKTTLAKKLSQDLSIPYYELDNIVYDGKIRNSDELINQKFNEIIQENDWIIEDVLRKQFMKALDYADMIIFLDINMITRDYRIIKRYIKRKFYNNEHYANTLKEVKQLLSWSHEFEKDKDNRLKLLDNYQNKTITVKNNDDIKKLIKGLRNKS